MIQYALIGAGGFGSFCLEQYCQMEQVQPVAVTDVNAEAARSAAESAGIEAVADAKTLLARDDVDLVHIATPPFTHADLARQALEAGKHVLCEKPLATTREDARELAQLARQKNKTLSVNLIMRYNPLCEAVKRIVEEGLLGEPLHGLFENYAGDTKLVPDHWFWDHQKSGGIFVEHGVHFFDLYEWWLGEGRLESAQQAKRSNTGVTDQVACQVRYRDDVLVDFYHGFTQPAEMDRQEFRLLFERGDLRLFEWVPTRMEIDCLATQDTIDRLTDLLPDAQVHPQATFEGDERTLRGRHKTITADGRYRVTASPGMAKWALYGYVVRSLLADQVNAIQNPDHQRRITEANGLRTVEMAIDADELARGK